VVAWYNYTLMKRDTRPITYDGPEKFWEKFGGGEAAAAAMLHTCAIKFSLVPPKTFADSAANLAGRKKKKADAETKKAADDVVGSAVPSQETEERLDVMKERLEEMKKDLAATKAELEREREEKWETKAELKAEKMKSNARKVKVVRLQTQLETALSWKGVQARTKHYQIQKEKRAERRAGS
jgi:hypothetical protein